MSENKKFDPTAPPPRWLNCPRKGEAFIADKFMPFKTPLSSKFDQNVPPECRFTMSMLLQSIKNNYNAKIGLIIDLTNTSRFYDCETEVRQVGVMYKKINCSGHDATPTDEQTQLFISTCEAFISKHPLEMIGVHCTHGFNRTGFMICAYLVEKLDFSIDAAIAMFARVRPPGIYKQGYIDELFNRYATADDERPRITSYPEWDRTEEDDDDDGSDNEQNGIKNESEDVAQQPPKKKRRKEFIKVNPEFASKISGIDAVTDPSHLSHIQQAVQKICNWEGAGFPGSQPVSMDITNVGFLELREYKVSWKADGTRYLMYINGKDKVYMLDRDNSVFRVHNLRFPKIQTNNDHLDNTLIDGEFVIDTDPKTNEKTPRYLIYDIIQYEGDNTVGKRNFNERLSVIDRKIIQPRTEALKTGRIQRITEPFGIRQKPFWGLIKTKELLSEDFKKQVLHGTDGLIFQPVDDHYIPGQCDGTLKWKPPSMNSVDFRLLITYREQAGMLKQDCEIGELYVGGLETRFSTIKLNKTLRDLHNKIVECKWNNEQQKWEFMRERTDKSYPNAYRTAMSVCQSIKFPVTEEILFSKIQNAEVRRNEALRQRMPPPPSIPTPPNN